MNELIRLELPVYEICTRRPFTAMDAYRGLLFSTEGDAVPGNAHYPRLKQKPFLCDEKCELIINRGSLTQETVDSRV